ncbi:glycosyltransferase [Candidatus Woesearchaeota archaeon]|nr:glycosyltransferase [Candidatus Woesearchaeota archaeon]
MDKVSVIITTKNEENHIKDCLKSVIKQTYPNIEIIVVDNNSTDDTASIAKRFGIKVYNKGPERSAQRNYGANISSGKYILYLDADMILSPDLVKNCVEIISKDPSITGLHIPEKIIGNGFWIKVRDFERSFYNGTAVDCVRFVSRKAFDEVNGFDLNMTGPEDWDFDKKIRSIGKVKITKSKLYHNEGIFNIRNYLVKKQYYSNSFGTYVTRWGKNDPDIKKQLGVFYRLFWVFIEKGKCFKLFAHPILTTGMYYLRLRVALNYLRVKK